MMINEKQTKEKQTKDQQVVDSSTRLSERDLWIIRGGPTDVNVTLEDDAEDP